MHVLKYEQQWVSHLATKWLTLIASEVLRATTLQLHLEHRLTTGLQEREWMRRSLQAGPSPDFLRRTGETPNEQKSRRRPGGDDAGQPDLHQKLADLRLRSARLLFAHCHPKEGGALILPRSSLLIRLQFLPSEQSRHARSSPPWSHRSHAQSADQLQQELRDRDRGTFSEFARCNVNYGSLIHVRRVSPITFSDLRSDERLRLGDKFKHRFP
jgi:hypothetical protein